MAFSLLHDIIIVAVTYDGDKKTRMYEGSKQENFISNILNEQRFYSWCLQRKRPLSF